MTAHAEVWKDIAEYEGLYQISSFGRVCSLERTVEQFSRHGKLMRRKLKGQVLRPQKYPNGYMFVSLGRDNTHLLHRLVANAFVGGDRSLQVNHKNGIRSDNRAENLEWVTCSDNHLHSYRELTRKKHSLTQKVMLWKGNQVLQFESGLDAAKFIGVVPGSISSAAIKGHKCRGYEVIYET
jgi:hypothetical protein